LPNTKQGLPPVVIECPIDRFCFPQIAIQGGGIKRIDGLIDQTYVNALSTDWIEHLQPESQSSQCLFPSPISWTVEHSSAVVGFEQQQERQDGVASAAGFGTNRLPTDASREQQHRANKDPGNTNVMHVTTIARTRIAPMIAC
jgi:hypothetical protein